MDIVRSLERRLERIFERSTSRFFGGRLHPSELAGRIAREADLARYDHDAGPATANRYRIELNPADLTSDTRTIEAEMEHVLATVAAENGLRLEGPPTVTIELSDKVATGQMAIGHSIEVGPQSSWARLVGNEKVELGPNRIIVGRAGDADITLPFEDVSRQHALVFRDAAGSHLADLDSSNGTFLDGVRIGSEPVTLPHGSMVGFATHQYRFLES